MSLDFYRAADKLLGKLGTERVEPAYAGMALGLMSPKTGVLGAYVDADGTLRNGAGRAISSTAPRTATVASSGTPTINTDTTDLFTITALAANITSFTTNLSGTPNEGQKLLLRIVDNGTSRTISHGASFRSLIGTLLTSTTAGKTSYEGFIWNAVDSIWDCLASGTQS